MKLTFPGICPSKKNSKQVFCRKGIPTVISSKAYTSWHKKMKELFKDVTLPKELEGRVYKFTYFFFIPLKKDGTPSKRGFDFSNKIESINDFLVDMGIIEDDSYNFIGEIHIYGQFVPYGEGKIELNIE